jgi:hypothetical protein
MAELAPFCSMLKITVFYYLHGMNSPLLTNP